LHYVNIIIQQVNIQNTVGLLQIVQEKLTYHSKGCKIIYTHFKFIEYVSQSILKKQNAEAIKNEQDKNGFYQLTINTFFKLIYLSQY